MKVEDFLRTDKKSIVIVGVGNVGSTLAYLLTLENRYTHKYDKISLVDHDILYETNFPYVNLDINVAKELGFISNPKVYALAYSLELIQYNMKDPYKASIVPVYNEYDTRMYTDDDFIVDCRDTPSTIKSFLKICQDGEFCRFSLDNDVQYLKPKSRYQIKNDKYYAFLSVSRILSSLNDKNSIIYSGESKEYTFSASRPSWGFLTKDDTNATIDGWTPVQSN